MIFKKKTRVGGVKLPNLKTYYKATVILTMWYWYKDRHIDQQNRTESAGINPHMFSQMIFDKDVKVIKWGKDSFSTNGVGKTEYSHEKEWISELPWWSSG